MNFNDPAQVELRLAVARDVLSMIDEGLITPSRGTYFGMSVWRETAPRISKNPSVLSLLRRAKRATDETGKPQCEACAIGSLFLAHVLRTTNPKLKADRYFEPQVLRFRSSNHMEMRDELEQVFTRRELGIFESVFEHNASYVCRYGTSQDVQLYESFVSHPSMHRLSDTETLRWIMGTLIAQKGAPLDLSRTPLYQYVTKHAVCVLVRTSMGTLQPPTADEPPHRPFTMTLPDLGDLEIKGDLHDHGWQMPWAKAREAADAWVLASHKEAVSKGLPLPRLPVRSAFQSQFNATTDYLHPAIALEAWPELGHPETPRSTPSPAQESPAP